MTRVGIQVAVRLVGYVALTAGLAALAWLAVRELAPGAGDLSPWPFAGPVACAAAAMCWVRTRAVGEHETTATAGFSPLRVAIPSAFVIGLAVFAPSLVPSAADVPSEVPPSRGVVHGLDGALLLRDEHRQVLWTPDEQLAVAAAGALPAGFAAAPAYPHRVRRRLFLAFSPCAATDHPLDPTAFRWLWQLSFALSACAILVGRARWRTVVWLALPWLSIVLL